MRVKFKWRWFISVILLRRVTPFDHLVKPGPVRLVFENGDDELFFVSGGFLEVIPSQITILADSRACRKTG